MSDLNYNLWNPELDDTPEQAALRDELLGDYAPLPSSSIETDPHLLHNTREFLKPENQKNMGSCQGNALTTAIECLIWKQTGRIQQLSRMFAYIRTQLKDGIRGDRGSSLTGGVWVAQNVGIPLETHWPYEPVRYTQRIPEAATANASQCRLEGAVRLDTYEKLVSFLREGTGCVMVGTAWGGNMSNVGERITSFRPGAGAHATVLSQVSPETLEDSEPDVDWVNSHGVGWGNNGTSRTSPDAIRQVLDHRMTRMLGGFFGLRGVILDPLAFADPFDTGKEGMIA